MSAPETQPAARRGLSRYVVALIPLVVFGGIAATAGKMLYDQDFHGKDISEIPSALLGTKAPSLNLAPLEGSNLPALTDAAVKGKLTLVNVFASWCIPCREEHPILLQLAEDRRFRLVGINYKDNPDNARRFLGQIGNPFAAVGTDPSGRIGIDWGVYGVPESFVIAADGTIAYKFIGPLTEQSLRDTLMPEVEKALTQNKK